MRSEGEAGQWREIRVELTRREDLVVRSRLGYYSQTQQVPDAPLNPKRLLLAPSPPGLGGDRRLPGRRPEPPRPGSGGTGRGRSGPSGRGRAGSRCGRRDGLDGPDVRGPGRARRDRRDAPGGRREPRPAEPVRGDGAPPGRQTRSDGLGASPPAGRGRLRAPGPGRTHSALSSRRETARGHHRDAPGGRAGEGEGRPVPGGARVARAGAAAQDHRVHAARPIRRARGPGGSRAASFSWCWCDAMARWGPPLSPRGSRPPSIRVPCAR